MEQRRISSPDGAVATENLLTVLLIALALLVGTAFFGHAVNTALHGAGQELETELNG